MPRNRDFRRSPNKYTKDVVRTFGGTVGLDVGPAITAKCWKCGKPLGKSYPIRDGKPVCGKTGCSRRKAK
jgi:hypothetical protein